MFWVGIFRTVVCTISLSSAILLCAKLNVHYKIFSKSNEPASSENILKYNPLDVSVLNHHLTALAQNNENSEQKLQISKVLFARDKRNDLARFLAAESDFKNNKMEGFIVKFLPLFATDRKNRKLYAQVLADSARNDEVFELISTRLKENQDWAHLVLPEISKKNIRPITRMTALYQQYPEAQKLLIRDYVKNGNYTQAYTAFQQFTLQKNTTPSMPYDPEFKGLKGETPFNWKINKNHVDRFSPNGLRVTYLGREPTTFLSQIFPLPQGRHKISVIMNGTIIKNRGDFQWTMRCISTNKLLGGGKLTVLEEIETPFTFHAFVDETCEFQKLEFKGKPGKVYGKTVINISKIKIDTGI